MGHDEESDGQARRGETHDWKPLAAVVAGKSVVYPEAEKDLAVVAAADPGVAEVVVVEHGQRQGTDMGGGDDPRPLMRNISSISFLGQISSFYFVLLLFVLNTPASLLFFDTRHDLLGLSNPGRSATRCHLRRQRAFRSPEERTRLSTRGLPQTLLTFHAVLWHFSHSTL